jgi:hypothetical protein
MRVFAAAFVHCIEKDSSDSSACPGRYRKRRHNHCNDQKETPRLPPEGFKKGPKTWLDL